MVSSFYVEWFCLKICDRQSLIIPYLGQYTLLILTLDTSHVSVNVSEKLEYCSNNFLCFKKLPPIHFSIYPAIMSFYNKYVNVLVITEKFCIHFLQYPTILRNILMSVT